MQNRLVDRLHQGEIVYGTLIVSPSPLWPAAVKLCGPDFVFLDTEHMPLGRVQLAHGCQIFRAMGIAPLVRIFNQDANEACKVLDGGATGVVVPYLEDPEQIKRLIAAIKLRPLKGERLARLIENPDQLGSQLAEYLQQRNRETIFIANIESMPAFNRLDDILTLPGLDGVFIGPHDLSCSMGLPEQYDHPDFEQAVATIIRKARANRIAVGIHFSESPQRQIHWLQQGITIVIHSSDLALFKQALSHDLELIKSAANGLRN